MKPRDQDDLQKWHFLAQVPYRDAEHPEIIRRAAALRVAAAGRPCCFAQLAHALVRDCISYVRDIQRTGAEDIAGFSREPTERDAVDALERGRDDCDAKARLFVALCLAGDLMARMRPLWRWSPEHQAERLAHVSAEVFLDNRWWPVETILARARLGDEPEQVPKEINTGRWRH